MTSRIRTHAALLLFATTLLWSGLGLAASPRFQADCGALSQTPHRLSGSDENARAAEYILERLRSLQPDAVLEQPFATAQTRVKRCEIQLEGASTPRPLQPMRPNGIIPPVTPTEGLRGPLVHIGDGSADAIRNKQVAGAIVVVDYNAREGWMRALRLGAQAVIFVRNGLSESWHSHWIDANVNVPRFYYEGDAADLVEGTQARIHSEIVWERTTGRNLFAFIRGTDPVFLQEKEEVLILSARLDSFGEVPRRSPGARGAANCAALLRLAEHFQQNRPRRHVLLAFFDSQARCLEGSSAFYRALESRIKDATAEARQLSTLEEKTFLTTMQEVLLSDAPLLQDESAIWRQLVIRMQDTATERAYDVSEAMFDLRKERLGLDLNLQAIKRGETPPADFDAAAAAARIAAINETLETDWQPRKDSWNALRRTLGRVTQVTVTPESELAELGAAELEKLRQVQKAVLEDVRLRLQEVEEEITALEADKALFDLLGETWITLHASLQLGDGSRHWGLIVGGDAPSRSPQDNPGLYGRIQSVFLRGYQDLLAEGKAPEHFLVDSANQSLRQTRVLWAGQDLYADGEPAGLFGIYNVTLGTSQERLPREGTPDDRLAHLDLERIEAQTDEIGQLLVAMSALEIDELPGEGTAEPTKQPPEGLAADADSVGVADMAALSQQRGFREDREYYLATFDDGRITGPHCMGKLPGSAVPSRPIAGGVVQLRLLRQGRLSFSPQKTVGFEPWRVIIADQNGSYSLGPLPAGGYWWRHRRGFAAFFDEGGRVIAASDSASATQVRYRLNMIDCWPGSVFLPPQLKVNLTGADEVSLLLALSNARAEAGKSFTETGDGVVGWYLEEREHGVKLFNQLVMLGLNSGPLQLHTEGGEVTPNGHGFDRDHSLRQVQTARRSAVDMWRLNESRLQILRDKDIIDPSLAELHGRSEDLLISSRRATAELDREALATSSFWASQPVYRKVRQTLDDLVFAVLLLLSLSVPFAFALERILIGAVTIYRQISWFAIFFILTFLALYFSHPAFAIATTPIIIFLGFIVVVMSVMVISIIMRKFEVELRALQGMTSTVHATDVSRVSTLVAAMQMGISTMRRRPLRTALTATTIVLLTFTILCFASFDTQSGIVTLYSSPAPRYTGVWLHRVDWSPMPEGTVDVVRGRWGDESTLCRRLWVSPREENAPGILITREDGSRPVAMRGVLGLEARELTLRPDLRSVIPEIRDDRVLLTESLARAISVEAGDWVLVKGKRLQVGPLLAASRLSELHDMDGGSILPADFSQSSTMEASEEIEVEQAYNTDWTSLPVDSVLLVSASTAYEMGADLTGMMIYTEDAFQSTELAEDLARAVPQPIMATRNNGAYWHVLGTVLSASGASDLFFPILLGGLVIFGTMLGSVADREKEIYTFSALGLAPRHVATLFFAESMVYSLIGGMGGYLLAQAVLKALTAMAEQGWVTVPSMNMSSTNTIVTIFIVMATVMISAIYPAIKASKSANPGLMRSWTPPPPQGDVLDLVFPFTVSEYDITGVVSFLKEHFDNHGDAGLGQFMAREARLVRDDKNMLGLDATLTLAPFDLGVSQSFALRSVPSEIPGIDEVRIILQRVSGQPKDWARLNRIFLDDLRQQFLIWRSIPHETMELYRERTLTHLGNEEAVEPEPTSP